MGVSMNRMKSKGNSNPVGFQEKRSCLVHSLIDHSAFLALRVPSWPRPVVPAPFFSTAR